MEESSKPSFSNSEIARLSRREFLVCSGLSVLWAATARAGSAVLGNVEAAAYREALGQTIFRLDRATDLLSLEMELLRFRPVRQRGQASVKGELSDDFAFHLDGGEPGYVILRLGGQHIAEQAIWDRPVLASADGEAGAATRPLPTYLFDHDDPTSGKSAGGGINDDIEFLRQGRFEKGAHQPRRGTLGGLSGAWLAGHTLLVFEVPRVLTPLPFDLDAILRLCLERCTLRVHPRLLEKLPPPKFFTGSADDDLRLHRPSIGHDRSDIPYTSVEFPSMLYISPYPNAHWHLRPRSWGDRCELWSLDLSRPEASDHATGRPRDTRRQGHLYAFDTEARPGRWPGQAKDTTDDHAKYGSGEHPKTSLYAATRRLLVGQMADDNGDIRAEDFRLTALGATAHLEYHPLVTPRLKKPTDRPQNFSDPKPEEVSPAKPVADGVTQEVGLKRQSDGFLSEWIQKSEIGRDYYVKESFSGYWFPFQLPAESVTVTERIFSADFPGGRKPPKLDSREAAITPGKEAEESGDELGECVGLVEERLTAMLVARKFGIVKERVRVFGGPESDDFDDIGARIARGMGIRRVEIRVDRTPTLSNQGTAPVPKTGVDIEAAIKAEIKARLARGEDGLFVSGGSGDGAGREVYWPRVAVASPPQPGDTTTPAQRLLTEYRFPVRLLTIDDQTIDTHIPMLFCYDPGAGAEYYNAARDDVKAMPWGKKAALADPQPAGALNATDLAVGEAVHLTQLLVGDGKDSSLSVLHPALGQMGEGPMQTSAVARGLSTLLGGVREQLFDHVAKFRASIEQWCDEEWKIAFAAKQKGALPQLLASVLAKVPSEVSGATQFVTGDTVALTDPTVVALTRQVIQLIAWGAHADKTVDAAQAAGRLADLVDLLDGSDAIGRVLEYCNRTVTTTDSLTAEVASLFAGLELNASAKLSALQKKLPALQAQWVARFGARWQRTDWDGWFAELFRQLDGPAAEKPCWRAPLTATLQKVHFRALLDLTQAAQLAAKGIDKVWPPMKGPAELPHPYKPFPELNGGVTPFAVPKELAGTLTEAFKRFRNDIEKEGAVALSRMRAAVEESLPDERQLRQRIQRLAEDYETLVSRGKKEKELVAHEVTRLQDEVALHLQHVTAFVDGGVRRASAFLERAASRVEHITGPLADLEEKAATFAKDFSKQLRVPDFKLPEVPLPTGNLELIQKTKTVFETFLQHVAETPPAQSLGQLRNLIDQTGVRLASDFRDQLKEVQALVRATRQQALGGVARIDAEVEALKNNAATTLAALRRAALDQRNARQQVFIAMRRAVDPWRATLVRLLHDYVTGAEGKPGPFDGLITQQGLASSWLGTTVAKLVSGVPADRLASRVADLLARIQSGANLPAETYREIALAEAQLEQQLARDWLADKDVLKYALDTLSKFSAQFDADFRRETGELADAIRAQEQAAKSCWQQLDAAEHFLAALLAESDAIVEKGITGLLNPLLVGDGVAAKLDEAWKKLTPTLEILQSKYGQTLPDLAQIVRGGVNLSQSATQMETKLREEFINQVATPLRQVATDVTGEFTKREKYLEGAALNLLRKAKVSMACPSLIKSYRDESAKAIHQVESVVFRMEESIKGKAQETLRDIRHAMGFPTLASLNVRLPDVAVVQEITHTAEYLTGGLRGLEKEAAGCFAQIKANVAQTLTQECGLSNTVGAVKQFSRELGGVADEFKKQLKGAQTAVNGLRKELENEAAKLTKKGKDLVNDLTKEFKTDVADLVPPGVSKLFGVLPMEKILAFVKSPDKAPQMLASQLPDRKEKTFAWVNEVQAFSLPGGLIAFDPIPLEKRPCQFRLQNTITVWIPKPGQPLRPPEVYTRGHIDAFGLTIAGMLRLHFKSVAFTSRNGDFDFKPTLGRVGKEESGTTGGGGKADGSSFMDFIGPLETVDKIRQKLQSFLNGKNGPEVGVDGDTIHAGYSFALPAIAFGAVAIEHISISLLLTLPLKGGAIAFLFKLCDRMEPFRVSVSGFAGGGYLGVQASSDRKLCWVEGSLEFGGSLSFNIGVAAGELYLMAGVYFRMEDAGVVLSGYVRAGGRVSVLGFIDLTIQFYLALTYEKHGQQTEFWGICTVSVRISIGFLKKTVQLTMEKHFQGAESSSGQAEGEKTTNALPWGARGRYAANVPTQTLLAQTGDEPPGGPDAGAGDDSSRNRDSGSSSAGPVHFRNIFSTEDEWSDYWKCFAV